MMQPGALAKNYVAGRRQPFVSPLRIYIMAFLLQVVIGAALLTAVLVLPVLRPDPAVVIAARARLGLLADPASAPPRPLYLKAPDAKPMAAAPALAES